MPRTPSLLLCASLWAAAGCASSQLDAPMEEPASVPTTAPTEDALPPLTERPPNPTSARVEVVGHVLEPERWEPTDARLRQLRVPDGFEVSVFARDLINPRILAVADDGTVYVTRRSVGDVLMLRDADGDGAADVQRTVARRPNMHGIAIDGDTVYLVTIKEIYRAQILEDGSFSEIERIVDDLPDAGQHPNRMVVVGPDGWLYVTAGSTCNACSEANPENATLLRIAPDGSSRSVYATGLRNTIGYGFVPGTSEIVGMDHGIDWLGDNEQPEEVNRIVEGGAYGWPYVYANGAFNPQDDPPNGITHAQWDAYAVRPVGLYTPHAAPMQMAFDTGRQFPETYRGDAFVAMRGSWNRLPPSGYEVVRLRLENGEVVGTEPFVTGFLQQEGDRWGHIGRLVGLAQAADGALLLTDDTNGMIYRIAYTGEGAGRAPTAPTNLDGVEIGPTGNAVPPPPAPGPEQLATEIVGTGEAALTVTSPSFDAGERIPEDHAAEGDNASPALRWSAGPAGTQSYVVLMEDPDVSTEPPFLHWALYNVPADVMMLEEGIPGHPKLSVPMDALQGPNDYGSLGYFGPRPPVGETHTYHVQVFALDTVLPLQFGASRTELLEAMEGHVLAAGDLVGTYSR